MSDIMPVPEQPKKDAELERLDRELRRAQYLQQISDARKAVVPQLDLKPVAAAASIDPNDVIETEILTYRMLRKLAVKVANDVDTATKGRAILIHHETDMTALIAFRSFQRQLSQLAAAFDDVAPAPVSPVAPAAFAITAGVAAAAAKALIDLTSLFQAERTVTGVAIAIEDLALISEVGGTLARKKRKVFVTQLYPRTADTDRIEAPMQLVRNKATDARERVKALPDGDEKSSADERLRLLEDLRKGYEDQFAGVVVSEGTPALATLVRGAGIDALLAEEQGASVLYLKILKAAGTNEVRRTFLKTKVRRSGGVIVNYVLFDADGSILLSSTAEAYSGEVDELGAT